MKTLSELIELTPFGMIKGDDFNMTLLFEGEEVAEVELKQTCSPEQAERNMQRIVFSLNACFSKSIDELEETTPNL